MSEETFRRQDKDRPQAVTRSYTLKWKNNIPTVEESNWAPGYTPGHMATVDEAVKYGMHRLQQELSDMREKWLNINTLAMTLAADDMEQADAVRAATDPHTEQVDHGGFEDH